MWTNTVYCKFSMKFDCLPAKIPPEARKKCILVRALYYTCKLIMLRNVMPPPFQCNYCPFPELKSLTVTCMRRSWRVLTIPLLLPLHTLLPFLWNKAHSIWSNLYLSSFSMEADKVEASPPNRGSIINKPFYVYNIISDLYYLLYLHYIFLLTPCWGTTLLSW